MPFLFLLGNQTRREYNLNLKSALETTTGYEIKL
jgi:hypothetical protein